MWHNSHSTQSPLGYESTRNAQAGPPPSADFRKALEMDPHVRRRFEVPATPRPARGRRLRAILEDQEFMKQLFPWK